jgi:hypothetical protein
VSGKHEETIERLKGLVEGKSEENGDAEQEALLEEEDPATEDVGADSQDEETADQKSSTREYVLLENTGKDGWAVVGRAVSASAEGALRSLGEEKLKDGVLYVAVPVRNWNPAPASVKKTTTISFS